MVRGVSRHQRRIASNSAELGKPQKALLVGGLLPDTQQRAGRFDEVYYFCLYNFPLLRKSLCLQEPGLPFSSSLKSSSVALKKSFCSPQILQHVFLKPSSESY